MPSRRGYLSRVVADAHRPTSLAHAMNTRSNFDAPLSSVANKISDMPADRFTTAKHGNDVVLAEKTHQEQVPKTSQRTRNIEGTDIRQPILLPDTPVGREAQHAFDPPPLADFAPPIDGDSDSITGIGIGQQKTARAVSSIQDAESTTEKMPVASQASVERANDSSNQQQEAQQQVFQIEKSLTLGAKHADDSQDPSEEGASTTPPRIMQDVHNMLVRESTEFKMQQARPPTSAQHASRQNLHQSAAASEAEITHQISEARMLETLPNEHATGEPIAPNRPEPTVPQVHIGQVDVVVVSQAKAPVKTPSTSAPGDFSSRNYLRRL